MDRGAPFGSLLESACTSLLGFILEHLVPEHLVLEHLVLEHLVLEHHPVHSTYFHRNARITQVHLGILDEALGPGVQVASSLEQCNWCVVSLPMHLLCSLG
jgi:hypothetical protein